MTKLGRKMTIATTAVLILGLTGCGNVEERSLCRQYEDLREAAAQIDNLDPETATVADAAAIVEDVMVQLDQFQAASEGIYDQAVSNLNLALTELRQATFDIGDESLEVARPLLEESWQNTLTAYSILEQRLDVVCGTD
ncbi:MAG TPA: hypothetical protein VFZ80_05540 [Acidimicrobiia bacterium]